MKKLTFVLFAVLMASCGNKKAKIVDHIKSYKDSITLVKKEELLITEGDIKKYEDMFWTNGEVDLKKVRDTKRQKEYSSYQTSIEMKRWDLKFKKAKFDKIIDSLELELKKY